MMKAAMCIDGEAAWNHWMGPPARVKGPAKEHLTQAALLYEVTLVQPLLDRKDLKVSGTGHEVNVEFPSGDKFALTFSEGEKCFLTGVQAGMTHWDGRKASMSVKLSEPKEFGDITYPAKTEAVVTIDGEVVETVKEELTAIAWNPEIRADEFKMPAIDVELMKASEKAVLEMKGVMLVHEGAYDGMGETIKNVYQVCQDAGLMMMAPVNAVFLNSPQEVEDPKELRTEIVLPVAIMGEPPAELPGGAVLKTLPAATVASMTARGPYGKADVEAIGKTMAWIEENGYEVAGPPRCVFFHNPEMTVAEDMVAEVQIPIRKKE
jgi:effector-binding domain-containing protein